MGKVRSRAGLMWGWTLVVVLYFAWEAASYRGAFAYMAEWQFDHFGQYLPTFNFGLLTIVLAWPALLLFRFRPASASRRPGFRAAEAPAAEPLDVRIETARDYMHFLYGFAGALLVGAAAALLWTLALPRGGGVPRDVSVQDQRQPAEGTTRLIGTVEYGRIASFSRGILFARRSELYAPVLPADGTRDAVRYFVEFAPDEQGVVRNGASLTRRTGILVRADLPGALIRLYRYLGYDAAKPYYVLYASPSTIRWPYYIIAIQFLIGSLCFLGAGLLQGRRALRLERDAPTSAA